jgi:hypothetical protein
MPCGGDGSSGCRIDYAGAMRNNEGFDVLHNGSRQTFPDQRKTAYEAARFAKSRTRGGISDRSTGNQAHHVGGWPDDVA